jgi:hypothetical protein
MQKMQKYNAHLHSLLEKIEISFYKMGKKFL